MLETLQQEYKLPDVFKITALEQLMAVRQAKLHFESIQASDVDFDAMLQKCRDDALRRRFEHHHKGGRDDMDVDAVHEGTGDGMYMGGGHWECSDWGLGAQDVDFVSKGKAKGKGQYGGWMGKGGMQFGKGFGDKGKGKGKDGGKGKGKGGKGKGPCHNCGQPGHFAR